MAESKPAGSNDADPAESSEMDNREIKAAKPTIIRDEATQEDTPDVPLRQCEKKKVTIILMQTSQKIQSKNPTWNSGSHTFFFNLSTG